MLLAVPNVSEGRDAERVSAIGATFDAAGVSLLDTHSDPDHNRAVFTLAGEPGPLADALLSGAGAAIEAIDMRKHHGVHPCVGALDVCPVVWFDPADREPAKAAALDVAERIGALGVPVFLYGDLASGPGRSERSRFRRGGVPELTLRMATGELPPDRGPAAPHPTAGATLVTARPPLAAFNVELDSTDADVARSVAAGLREGGGGLAGVRAIGLALADGRTQVSANVHDPVATPLGRVVSEVRRLAGRHGARPVAAEVVGLVPEASLAAYPDDVPIGGFDPDRHLIERRLESLRG
jgi:glutamate formiminotransferase/glutamate formiminotransferase/formiminotetrahydrofolate cyclodeaminase